MQQNIVTVEVPASLPEPAQEISAGNMYEHNATALEFVLDETLVSADYKYYLEFVTLGGVSRTEYLTPDETGKILFSVPQAVTAQMTALCVLNIVQVSDDGVTEQLIKAQTVRLHFSPLENTEKQLCADYEFTINSLLAAIENDTFKGDKGDKGDAYILTDADKTEIASHVDEAFYGLPLQKQAALAGSGVVTGAAGNAEVHGLSVVPRDASLAGEACAMIAVGHNEIAWLLDSAQYGRFEQTTGSYCQITLTLEPNTEYVLLKADAKPSVVAYSYLQIGKSVYWFCHKEFAEQNKGYMEFTTSEDGLCVLVCTNLYISAALYETALNSDWRGLGIYKKADVLALQQSFDDPLYRLDADCTDAFDFIRGTCTRRTAKLRLSADMLTDSQPLQSGSAGEATAYRYTFTPPVSAPTKQEGYAGGLCALLPVMDADVTDAEGYAQYVEQTGQTGGVWFGGHGIVVLSTTPPDALAAYLSENTLEVLYAAVSRTQTLAEPRACTLPAQARQYVVAPDTVCATMNYRADLSAVVQDLESRLAALENTL